MSNIVAMRPIPGYEGIYDVSEDGRIWSCANRLHDGLWLKPSLKKGYPFVCLARDGRIQQVLVHRLVAAAFVPNPTNLPQVNHRNGRKDDNYASNLEWCTPHQNTLHAHRTGLAPVTEPMRAARSINSRAARMANRKLTFEQAEAVRVDRNGGATYEALQTKYGVSPASLRDIVASKTYKERL